jgi:multisubunit Na+/H+ antiporter MnhC subunit
MHPLTNLLLEMTPGIYVGSGAFVIQLGNLIVIILMLVLFGLALVLPFSKGKSRK